MMKRFKEIGKWTGLMLVACSLLFAGCAQDSSSEEGALGSDSASSLGIPVEAVVGADGNVDELIFGNGGDSGMAQFDGHTVEIINGSTGCTAGPSPECAIRVINRAKDHYMANTIVYTNQSGDASAQFNTADYDETLTNMHSAPPDGSSIDARNDDVGYTASVEGGGYCVVEDGMYGTGYDNPFNMEGCECRFMPANTYKPYQMLEPNCGNQEVHWDFGNHAAGNFPFFAQIQTEWWPENPHDDARYDFQDRTTMYLMITDLEDTMTATYKDWYRIGSYRRSNILAGWNAAGAGNSADSGVSFGATTTGVNGNSDAREYFALNVAMEYPDRIESYDIGDKGNFTNYEYYTKLALVITYDNEVVERVTADGKTRAGKGNGTNVAAGGLEQCSTGNCGIGLETFRGMESPGGSNTNFQDGKGYILTYEFRFTTGFTWLAANGSYSTVSGDVVMDYYGGRIPANAGQYGVANVRMDPIHAFTATYPDTIFYYNSAVIQEGVDEDPDLPVAMYFFKIIGEPGDGTWMRSNMFASDSQPELQWTNGTIEGGYGAGSDDTLHDVPFSGVDQGTIVAASLEQSNPNISHTGFAIAGNGAYQAWNVHICVQ